MILQTGIFLSPKVETVTLPVTAPSILVSTSCTDRVGTALGSALSAEKRWWVSP